MTEQVAVRGSHQRQSALCISPTTDAGSAMTRCKDTQAVDTSLKSSSRVQKQNSYILHSQNTHRHTLTPTLADVLNGPTYAPVKGTGVSRALESQSELLVINPPVVKNGGDLVVHDVFLQDTLQHHLTTDTEFERKHSTTLEFHHAGQAEVVGAQAENSIIWRLGGLVCKAFIYLLVFKQLKLLWIIQKHFIPDDGNVGEQRWRQKTRRLSMFWSLVARVCDRAETVFQSLLLIRATGPPPGLPLGRLNEMRDGHYLL